MSIKAEVRVVVITDWIKTGFRNLKFMAKQGMLKHCIGKSFKIIGVIDASLLEGKDRVY